VASGDSGPWSGVAPVVIGGIIATITAFWGQWFANRAERSLEQEKLKNTLAVEDYKNNPSRAVRDATRLLEQQLVFAQKTIGKLAQDARTGRCSIVWNRRRDLFAVAYDIHAPKATAMRLVEMYEDRIDSWTRDDKALGELWLIVELLNELFLLGEDVAKCAPALAKPRLNGPDQDFTEYLAADVLAKLMIGTKGIASRGSFDQRLTNGNKELMAALVPSRKVLQDFSPTRSPAFWRLLLCEAALADAVSSVRRAHAERLAEWPPADVRAQLRWSDDEKACESEFAAARTFVQARLKQPRAAALHRRG
jgi:hypothetical protein